MADQETTAPPPGNGAAPHEGRAIVRRPDRTPLSQRDPVALAQHFANSGFFTDATSMSKAVVKIVAGEELGIGPMAAMTGIHIIEGKPCLSANLLGVQVKRSAHYDFRPTEISAQKVVVTFFEDGEKVGTSEFTIEQARQITVKQKGSWIKLAETSRWMNYPQAMLFARALSQGVRMYCPDVTAGTPAYTPEELGADVNEAGDPVYVGVEVETPAQDPAPTLPAERVEQLVKGFEIAGPEMGGVNDLDGLNVLLGSLGVDGWEPGCDVAAEFSKLSPEIADQVEAEFQAVIDRAASDHEEEEVDAEIVSEVDQEGGGADA